MRDIHLSEIVFACIAELADSVCARATERFSLNTPDVVSPRIDQYIAK